MLPNKIDNRAVELSYAANNPIEDKIIVTNLNNINGYFVGIYDGHGGKEMKYLFYCIFLNYFFKIYYLILSI